MPGAFPYTPATNIVTVTSGDRGLPADPSWQAEARIYPKMLSVVTGQPYMEKLLKDLTALLAKIEVA